MDSKSASRERTDTAPAPVQSVGPALVAGRFEVLGILGRGGMASVYRARDLQLDEIVALKVMSRELAADPISVERFRREVKLARRVTHRNVARSFDIGEHDGQLFLTMELVEGESLAERLARVGRLSEEETVAIAQDVCAGLEAAHAAGVVHRDLKPDNVLLASDGRAVLTDFGIASARLDTEHRKRTVGVMVGTPEYIAPEQVEGARDLDGRADLYALGAMMYELVTGTAAWEGDTALAIVAARLSHPPPDPRARALVSDALANIILECMARAREARPATASEVGERLAALRPLERPAASSPQLTSREGVVVFARTAEGADAIVTAGLRDLVERHLRGGTTLRVVGVPRSITDAAPDVAARALRAAFYVELVVVLGPPAEEEDASTTPVGSQLLVAVRLVRVHDDSAIATFRHEAAAAQLFALASSIAANVAERLLAQHRTTLPAGPTDPATIALWLRARVAASSGTVHGRDEAVVLLEQAITRTPQDPWVLSTYAATLVARSRASWTSAGDLHEAHAMAEEVLRGESVLGEAWLARALARLELGRPVEAMRDLGRARRAMSAFGQIHAVLGRMFLETTENSRAMRHLTRAVFLDPSLLEPELDLVEHAFAMRHPAVAALAEDALQKHPDAADAWMMAARACLRTRDIPRARLLHRSIRHGAPLTRIEPVLDVLGAVEGENVATALASFAWLAESDPTAARRSATQRQIEAEIAAFHGDLVHALDACEAAVRCLGFCDLAWIDGCSLLDPVRLSPRFVALRGAVEEKAAEVRRAMDGSDFDDE